MKHHRTPADQARSAIRDALAAFSGTTRKHPAALICDTAAAALESRGMAPDTAADLVARVWKDDFSIKEAN